MPQMKRREIQAIHCMEALHSLYIGYYCKRMLGIPLSVTIHADSLYMGDWWPIFRPALQACDFITSVCEYNRNLLINDFGIQSDRVHVVRLFTDIDAFRPDNRVKILIVGQFSKRKGHDTLFKAIKMLNRAKYSGLGRWGRYMGR